MATDTTTDNIYLSGNYAPVVDEVTAIDLPVEGELPTELNGRYLRNGPNPAADPDAASHHWFLGDGMVHGVRLNEGRVEWYRNRYVGSADMAAHRGEPDVGGPNWNSTGLGPNTNVFGFAGTTWAVMEAGAVPVELGYELETVGRNDFFGTLPGAFTAHPKYDATTGEVHAMAYAWAEWMDHMQYIVIGTDGRVRRTLDIALPGMSMVHDMSLTERYAVVYDQPVTIDIEAAMAGSRFPFHWDPDYGRRVGLLPREGEADDLTWVDVPVGYSFHPLNAYDDADGRVVIDLCDYDAIFAGDRRGPFGDGNGRLERWEIDPDGRTATTTVVDDRPSEFPRVAGAVTNRPHRYGYCAAPDVSLGGAWPTVKHDLSTGERSVFHHGPGRAGGEAVFVARENSTAEDDGWLLMFVHDQTTAGTDFVVLDAREFDRGYVARVPLPRRVPFGFHGNWVSDAVVAPGSAAA